MNWNKIETAPKDGTVLLLWDGKTMRFGSWKKDYNVAGRKQWLSEDGNDWSCGYYFTPLKPTHWMKCYPPDFRDE